MMITTVTSVLRLIREREGGRERERERARERERECVCVCFVCPTYNHGPRALPHTHAYLSPPHTHCPSSQALQPSSSDVMLRIRVQRGVRGSANRAWAKHKLSAHVRASSLGRQTVTPSNATLPTRLYVGHH